MFWSYFFRYAFCQDYWQKEDMETSQKIVDFVKEHYPIDEAWTEEFVCPKTEPEKMKAPKENYVRQLSYFPGHNSKFNIHYIRFYPNQITYSTTMEIEAAKKESAPRMSFKTYKKAVASCGVLSGILLAPVVYIREEEMPEFQKLIREGLMETTLSPNDYDELESLIMAYGKASAVELKSHKLSLLSKYWLTGAGILMLATLWFQAKHAYSYIGESGLYRAMVDSFSFVPIYLYLFGSIYVGILYILFVEEKQKGKEKKSFAKERRTITVISTAVFLALFGWLISSGVLALMDAKNLNQQMAKVSNEEGYGGRIKPWTWEGLEEITLENPKVIIGSYHGRHSGAPYYGLKASNIRKSFKLSTKHSAESLQRNIDRGETIIVYYYQHSRVVERICNKDYDILTGNTIYQLPESLDIPYH